MIDERGLPRTVHGSLRTAEISLYYTNLHTLYTMAEFAVIPEWVEVIHVCMYVSLIIQGMSIDSYIVPTCSLVHGWLSCMLVQDNWVGEINSISNHLWNLHGQRSYMYRVGN